MAVRSKNVPGTAEEKYKLIKKQMVKRNQWGLDEEIRLKRHLGLPIRPDEDGVGEIPPKAAATIVEEDTPLTEEQITPISSLEVDERIVGILEDSGFETIEQVSAVSDLTTIDGIGEKYAEKIRKSLEGGE